MSGNMVWQIQKGLVREVKYHSGTAILDRDPREDGKKEGNIIMPISCISDMCHAERKLIDNIGNKYGPTIYLKGSMEPFLKDKNGWSKYHFSEKDGSFYIWKDGRVNLRNLSYNMDTYLNGMYKVFFNKNEITPNGPKGYDAVVAIRLVDSDQYRLSDIMEGIKAIATKLGRKPEIGPNIWIPIERIMSEIELDSKNFIEKNNISLRRETEDKIRYQQFYH